MDRGTRALPLEPTSAIELPPLFRRPGGTANHPAATIVQHEGSDRGGVRLQACSASPPFRFDMRRLVQSATRSRSSANQPTAVPSRGPGREVHRRLPTTISGSSDRAVGDADAVPAPNKTKNRRHPEPFLCSAPAGAASRSERMRWMPSLSRAAPTAQTRRSSLGLPRQRDARTRRTLKSCNGAAPSPTPRPRFRMSRTSNQRQFHVPGVMTQQRAIGKTRRQVPRSLRSPSRKARTLGGAPHQSWRSRAQWPLLWKRRRPLRSREPRSSREGRSAQTLGSCLVPAADQPRLRLRSALVGLTPRHRVLPSRRRRSEQAHRQQPVRMLQWSSGHQRSTATRARRPPPPMA